jgi:hypothetical protein
VGRYDVCLEVLAFRARRNAVTAGVFAVAMGGPDSVMKTAEAAVGRPRRPS